MDTIRTQLEHAAEAAGMPVPKVIYGSNDRLSRTLRSVARASVRDILASMPSGGYSDQISTWVFRTQPGEASYPLPPDFYDMIPGTQFRDTWPVGLLGPTPSWMWARWRAGFSVPSYPFSWRVLRNRMYLEPIPAAQEVVTVEYLSKFPVIKQVTGWDNQLWDGAPGDHAKAPYVTHEGHLAVTATDLGLTSAEFDAKFRLLTPPNGWDASSDLNGDGYPDAFVRKEGLTEDTDIVSFDHDLFLSSLIWRLRREVRKPYAEEKLDFERIRSSTAAIDNGGLRDICFSSPGMSHEGGDQVLFSEDGSGSVVFS